ncbi:MAG: flavodoxin reductase [Saprospiraceae bacterium]|nr:flavodoxin reductase [Saprospiraceae bacterium]
MGNNIINIRSINQVTKDFIRIVTSKPPEFTYKQGQAAQIAINKNGWLKVEKPFTFTCLPANDYLEFTIKTPTGHKGITNDLLLLQKYDELVLHSNIGVLTYKGEGVFIDGGDGITSFIDIFRQLKAKNEIGKNKLIFANKTKADIILEEEFKTLFEAAYVNILSDEKIEGYHYGNMTEEFIREMVTDFDKQFYASGGAYGQRGRIVLTQARD